MAAAPRNGEAEQIIVAPTGPLIVPALAAGDAQPVLSLVVPTLNESENIADFLAAVRQTLDQALPGRYEVIVVDDDSADRTWEIAARLLEGFPAPSTPISSIPRTSWAASWSARPAPIW